MPNKLPFTPAHVLDISNTELATAINSALDIDKSKTFWKLPRKDAATLLEEMTAADMIDWACKAAKPVMTMEDGIAPSSALSFDASKVKLPDGFSKKQSLTFGAAGDLLFADGLENSQDILFENVADLLFEQDISFANFESPVTTQPLIKEVISERSPPIECSNNLQFKILTSYKDKNFTVLNTANNHMYDMGIEGINTTLNAFADAGILAVGTNQTADKKRHPKTLTLNGIKLGFVAYTFGLNGHEIPNEESYLINTANLCSNKELPNLNEIKFQIDECKLQHCDFIITSLHWGYEFEAFPRLRQIDATHELIEYGADAIICHHPHMIQPVEYYSTKRDPARICPIAYSLGSLTWGYIAPHLVLSLIQNLTLNKGNHQGRIKTYVEKSCTTPVFRSATIENGRYITRIEKLEKYTDQDHLKHSKDYLQQIKHYADLILNPVYYQEHYQSGELTFSP